MRERACAGRNRKVTANFGMEEDDEYFANGSQIWDGGGGSTLRTVRKIWEEDEEGGEGFLLLAILQPLQNLLVHILFMICHAMCHILCQYVVQEVMCKFHRERKHHQQFWPKPARYPLILARIS